MVPKAYIKGPCPFLFRTCDKFYPTRDRSKVTTSGFNTDPLGNAVSLPTMANRKVVIFLNDGQLLVVKEALLQHLRESELWEHKNSECLAAIIIDIYDISIIYSKVYAYMLENRTSHGGCLLTLFQLCLVQCNKSVNYQSSLSFRSF